MVITYIDSGYMPGLIGIGGFIFNLINMKDYQILCYKILPSLMQHVNELLAANWICIGGIVIADNYYYQTMVKLNKKSKLCYLQLK